MIVERQLIETFLKVLDRLDEGLKKQAEEIRNARNALPIILAFLSAAEKAEADAKAAIPEETAE